MPSKHGSQHVNDHRFNPIKGHRFDAINGQDDDDDEDGEDSEDETPGLPYPDLVEASVPTRGKGSWLRLGVEGAFARVLVEKMGLAQPTLCQQMSVRLMMQGHDVLLHAPTGSGKTLAFAIPTLHRIAQHLSPSASHRLFQTVALQPSAAVAPPRMPARKVRRIRDRKMGVRALFMVPTIELAAQMMGVLTQLLGEEGCAETCRVLTGGSLSVEAQLEEMRNDPRPVVVATPARLLDVYQLDRKLHGSKGERMALNARMLRALVVDEIDLVVQPLSRYAPLKKKRNHFVHPPPGKVFLTELLRDLSPSTSISKTLFSPVTKPAELQTVFVSATLSQTVRHLARRLWMRRPVAAASDPSAVGESDGEPTEGAELRPVHLVRVPGSFSPPTTIKHYYALVDDDTPSVKTRMLRQIIQANPDRGSTTGLLLFGSDKDMAAYSSLLIAIPNLTIGPLSLTTPLRLDGYMHLILANYRQVRGLHFEGMEYLFLMDPPNSESEYLHLSGRTGRVSKDAEATHPGQVVTFSTFTQLSKLKRFSTNLGIVFDPLNVDYAVENQRSASLQSESPSPPSSSR